MGVSSLLGKVLRDFLVREPLTHGYSLTLQGIFQNLESILLFCLSYLHLSQEFIFNLFHLLNSILFVLDMFLVFVKLIKVVLLTLQQLLIPVVNEVFPCSLLLQPDVVLFLPVLQDHILHEVVLLSLMYHLSLLQVQIVVFLILKDGSFEVLLVGYGLIPSLIVHFSCHLNVHRSIHLLPQLVLVMILTFQLNPLYI